MGERPTARGLRGHGVHPMHPKPTVLLYWGVCGRLGLGCRRRWVTRRQAGCRLKRQQQVQWLRQPTRSQHELSQLPTSPPVRLSRWATGSRCLPSVGNHAVFLEAFTSQIAGDATACELSRAAVTLATLDNKQCCSCVPAMGSTVSAASLAVHTTETECITDSAGARLGGTWVCSGVGPYCTTD